MNQTSCASRWLLRQWPWSHLFRTMMQTFPRPAASVHTSHSHPIEHRELRSLKLKPDLPYWEISWTMAHSLYVRAARWHEIHKMKICFVKLSTSSTSFSFLTVWGVPARSSASWFSSRRNGLETRKLALWHQLIGIVWLPKIQHILVEARHWNLQLPCSWSQRRVFKSHRGS